MKCNYISPTASVISIEVCDVIASSATGALGIDETLETVDESTIWN